MLSLDEDASPEDILRFVEDHRANKVVPYVRSQRKAKRRAPRAQGAAMAAAVAAAAAAKVSPGGPGAAKAGAIASLNTNTFLSKAFPDVCRSGQLTSLILFHVSWCGFCQRAMNIFREAAAATAIGGPGAQSNQQAVRFYTMDCDRNDCYPSVLAGLNTDKLPLIAGFVCGEHQPHVFGNRTSEANLQRWMHALANGTSNS